VACLLPVVIIDHIFKENPAHRNEKNTTS